MQQFLAIPITALSDLPTKRPYTKLEARYSYCSARESKGKLKSSYVFSCLWQISSRKAKDWYAEFAKDYDAMHENDKVSATKQHENVKPFPVNNEPVKPNLTSKSQGNDKDLASKSQEYNREKEEKEKQLCIEVIEYLNQKAKKSFKLIEANFKNIKGRLSESYKLEDFKAVIDYKSGQWVDNPDMSQYLQPTTLFAPSKFDGYLQASKTAVKTNEPLAPAQPTPEQIAHGIAYQRKVDELKQKRGGNANQPAAP
jgi:uncharacterized phage protein (TIGR02220 family)